MSQEKVQGRKAFFASFLISFLIIISMMAIAVLALRSGNNTPEEELYIPRQQDALTLLVCGTDTNGQATSFALIGYLPQQGRIPVVVLPTQTLVRKGSRNDTLGGTFKLGGGSYCALALGEALGVGVDRWVEIDRAAFEEILGIFGPVDFTLDTPLQVGGTQLSPGLLQLDATTAAEILLYSAEGEGADVSASRAAALIAAILNQKLPQAAGQESEALFKAVQSRIKTDISLTDFMQRRESGEFMAGLSEPPALGLQTTGTLNAAGNTLTLSQECIQAIVQAFRGK